MCEIPFSQCTPTRRPSNRDSRALNSRKGERCKPIFSQRRKKVSCEMTLLTGVDHLDDLGDAGGTGDEPVGVRREQVRVQSQMSRLEAGRRKEK